MNQITLTPAQGGWLEAAWTRIEVQADGSERAVEVKHVSYHPTQVALLQADATALGTPLAAHASLLDRWVADYVLEPAPASAVPAVVSMRQARLALLAAGKLTATTTAINALPSPTKEAAQIEWEYSQEVRRSSPLIAALAPALSMTQADLNALFVAAAKL